MSRWMRGAVWLLLGCAAAGTAAWPAPAGKQVLLIATVNARGTVRGCGCGSERTGGLAEKVGVVDRLREQQENVLLVDAGDAVAARGGQVPNERVIAGMAAGRYAALNVGDEEAAWGLGYLRPAAAEAGLNLLSSNLIERATGRPAFTPELSLNLQGVRVALLGVIAPGWEQRQQPAVADELTTLDPAAALAERVPRLRGNHDLVVVLAQLRLAQGRTLLEQVPGIDVIVGGEERSSRERAGPLGGAFWLQSRPYGKGMMMARIRIGADGPSVLGWRRVLFPLGGPTNAGVARILAGQQEPEPPPGRAH